MRILHPDQRICGGFTLIECLIVLAITAVLAAISLPLYTDHVRRSHRSNARVTLVQAAHWLERAAAATGTYPAATQLPSGILLVDGSKAHSTLVDAGSLTVVSDRYAITATTDGGQSFRLSATPVPGGAQASDPCGMLVLDQAGRRTVQSSRLPAESCWTR